MMDSRTIGKRSLQPEEQENGSLYLHLISSPPSGDFSIWYKIGLNEANFSKEEVLISKELQQVGCGSAICGTTLYLFGGWEKGQCMKCCKQAYSLDLASSKKKFDTLDQEMQSERDFPKTITVGENIFIFGSDRPGYGEFSASETEDKPWAEVLNTTLKTFKRLPPPPNLLFQMSCLGVSALIEKNEGGDEILIAPNDFSHLFFYNVKTDIWHSKPTNITSPFPLYSMRSPVTDKYIFLYGKGKICAFDIDKNQFLKNNLSLSKYALFDECEIHGGVIHHLGGSKFCVVFSEYNDRLFTHLHVVSFDIANVVSGAQLDHIEASEIKVADYVLSGVAFYDSVKLSSTQIVSSGNLNNGKRPRKNDLIEKGQSSGTSHVDDDGIMDYGAISKPGNDQDLFKDTLMSKLQRMRVVLDKELVQLSSERVVCINKIAEFKKTIDPYFLDQKGYMDKLKEVEEGLSNFKINDDDIIDKSNAKGGGRRKIILDGLQNCEKERWIQRFTELMKTLPESLPNVDFYMIQLRKIEGELSKPNMKDIIEKSDEKDIAKLLSEIDALEEKILKLTLKFSSAENLMECGEVRWRV